MMTWILRDGAWRGWLLWLALGALNTSLFMNFALMDATRRGTTLSSAPVLLIAWIGLVLYLLFGQTRTRCGALQLALPMDARRIWLVHTASVSAAAALLVAGMIGVGLALARLLGRLATQDIDPLSVLATGVAGAILAAVLIQIPKPRLSRVPFSPPYASWFAVSLVAVGALSILCVGLGAAWALLPLALAVGAAVVAMRRVPHAFTLVPFEAADARARAPVALGAGAVAAPAGAAGIWRTRRHVATAVLHGVSSGNKEWFGQSFILLFGVVAGGGLSVVDPDLEVLRYVYVLIAAYLLFAMTGPRTLRLHHLDPLPLSRRAMFAVLVLPYAAAFAAGYGVGALLQSSQGRSTELVQYARAYRGYEIRVPAGAWAVAFGQEARAVRAAARERRVRALPVWRGLDVVMYSPYALPAGSPIDVVAERISRAAEAVYGSTIPPAEIAARYLETQPDGIVAPRGDGLTLRRDHPGLAPRDPGPLFPVLLAAVLMPWLLLAALLFRTYREGIADRVRYVVAFGPAVLLVLGGVGMAALMFTGISGPWVVQAAFVLPLRSMAGSVAVPLTWIACAALTGGAYLLAQRAFRRMEIPARPFRFTLVDWLRDDT